MFSEFPIFRGVTLEDSWLLNILFDNSKALLTETKMLHAILSIIR